MHHIRFPIISITSKNLLELLVRFTAKVVTNHVNEDEIAVGVNWLFFFLSKGHLLLQ